MTWKRTAVPGEVGDQGLAVSLLPAVTWEHLPRMHSWGDQAPDLWSPVTQEVGPSLSPGAGFSRLQSMNSPGLAEARGGCADSHLLSTQTSSVAGYGARAASAPGLAWSPSLQPWLCSCWLPPGEAASCGRLAGLPYP